MSYTESEGQLWRSFPLALPSDAGQCQWQGGFVGCGPQTAAVLLGWWAGRLGLALPASERDALAVALAPDLGAWRVPLSGGARAVQPWDWLLGINRVLEREKLPLRARGHWGYRPNTAPRLAHNWAQAWPTVGFEWSPHLQHFGLLSAYGVTERGLEGLLVAPFPDKPTMYLQPRLGLGGVMWLEPR